GFDGRGELDLPAFKEDVAAIGTDGAGQGLDERGLARTIVADDGEDFAGHEVEVAIVERGDAAVALVQTAGGKNGFHQADTFLIHWSMATAAMMSAPMRR